MKRTLLLSLCLLSLTPAFAQDVTQWRGANRDAKLTGFSAPANWPKALTRKWKVTVGEGHSSPLIVGSNVFIFAREGENEITRCLSIATGKEVWQESYPAPYTMNPVATGHGKGPKSTSVYANGNLYTLGISGTLSCLDAKTGKKVWRENFVGTYPQTSPAVGTAMSPVFDKGVLFAHVGGENNGAITAFDAKTGKVRWRWTEDGPAYASPILVTIDGVRQLVTQTQKQCVSLDATTGKLLWSLPFTTAYDQNSVTPLAVGQTIVFAGMQKPTFAVRARKTGTTWTAEKIWETRDVTMYMSSPVASGGRLYGMSERRSGQMFTIDAATGKVLWTGEGRLAENVSVWDGGSVVLTLTTGADLIV